jgi:PAS domain S-box-containing protein
MIGYGEPELLTRDFDSLAHPEDVLQQQILREGLVAGKREGLPLEGRYLRKDGALLWMRLVGSCMRAPEGRVTRLVYVAEDVTAHKLAEQRVHRRHLLHAVVGRIGEAVAQGLPRRQLYETVCRLLVEEGQLRLTFIAEWDAETGRTRPFASHGAGADQLLELLAASPLYGGVAKAGHEGEILDLCNDIAAAPRLMPWHESGLRRGLCATASFRLELHGSAIVALVLYAAEPDYFLDEETALLAAVARSVALALGALRRSEDRERADRVFQRERSELQMLLDFAPVMIVFKDLDDRVVRANQRAASFFGKEREEIIGKPATEAIPSSGRRLHVDDLEVLRSGEPRLGIVDSFRGRDGRSEWIQIDKVPCYDENGTARGILVMSQDVTERKRVESRYRRLVDSSVQSVMFWNTRGEVMGANDAFLRLTGYSREDLEAGRISWAAMTPPEFAHLDQRALQEISVEGICATYEKEWIRKDGVRVPILIGAAIFEDDPEEGVCFALDLTQRVRSETLRSNEKRVTALLEQTTVGVARIDARNGRYLHVNPRFAEILGRSPEELLQRTAADITHSETVVRDPDFFRQIKTGAAREFGAERHYLRKDGSAVWVHLTVSEMWAPGDSPDYYLAVIQDISERKQLEEHFRQAQKMQALGTLAGGIAHDFNNILASITGYAALAQLKLEGNVEVRGHLESVLTAGGRAAALVRQILAFSRQEHLQRSPIALHPILDESIQMLRSSIPSSVDIVASLAVDAPTVFADATQISQILMNLGTNAWHAMQDRPGRIEFTLEQYLVDATQAALQPGLRTGLHARISVRDTGCGMSAVTLQRIFEPFFTTKSPGQGTGLGLAVVHGIVESHDGVVCVQSRPGEGTVFQLYFPAYAAMTGETAPEEGSVPRGEGEWILIVDDDELLAELGRATLAALGYRVDIVTQPEAALERVRADPAHYRLVLTDQTMPTMTGLALAEALRKLRADLPIILMTGYSASLTPQAIEAVGISGLLLKPATLRSLAVAAHAALSTGPVPEREA